MADKIHSTGRGGAGNIGSDPTTTYVDGDIVREGVYGESSRPEYSAGRGGAGNMVNTPRSGTPVANATPQTKSPALGPRRPDEEIVPETATRGTEGYENFHTGRGGQGNVHRDKYGGHSGPQKGEGEKKEGLLEKAKHAIGLDGKKEK